MSYLKNILFALIGVVLLSSSGYAQSDFYDQAHVPEIRIYFDEPNWDAILDSFYIAGDEERLVGAVEIDGNRFEYAGIRYKGFSSVSVNRIKNPFNIKLDYVIDGQEYQGINKIKLSNVIQDPSFVRETLSYEIARKYMPASRANYANVYVNDTLMGLYTNVESVNKDFLEDHFGSRDNTFVKCNPDHLDLNGENSNLGNSPGTDLSNYETLYDLKSDFGWEELYMLIDQLNNNPDSIHRYLNVDRALWMHAFNYALINFDSYVGYAQNYYLYVDDHGRFNPILWDLNMSFGSYRLTDASDHWNGFTIAEAPLIDPLSHHNSVSVLPRPLLRNLLANPTYRRMYLAHLRTIMAENIDNGEYATRGSEMQFLIAADVASDTNKFYSYDDFIDNLTTTVSDLTDYTGITELMDARSTYLATYGGVSGAPTVANETQQPVQAIAGQSLSLLLEVSDAQSVFLFYRTHSDELFKQVSMLDDGTQNDGSAADGIYGYTLPTVGNQLQYYFYAENDSAGVFSPARAAYEFNEINIPLASGDLVINELMAINEQSLTDETGAYEDWFELYNASGFDISTANLFVSDDGLNRHQWQLPATILAPNEYLLVWADSDEDDGEMHANFRLDANGEQLYLTNADSTLIDHVSWEIQYPLVSYGRFPNGSGSFQEMRPSPAAENQLTDDPLLNQDFFVYPNPASTELNIKTKFELPYQFQLTSADGRAATPVYTVNGAGLVSLPLNSLNTGFYLLHLWSDDVEVVEKIIID